METEVKLCRYCKWSDQLTGSWEHWKCINPQVAGPNLVVGGVDKAYCELARKESGACGPTAEKWEPREG